jgi:hypothetical protein
LYPSLPSTSSVQGLLALIGVDARIPPTGKRGFRMMMTLYIVYNIQSQSKSAAVIEHLE